MKENKTPIYTNLNYGSDFSRLAQNENPYGASPKAIETILKNINCVSQYPEVVPIKLKEALAELNKVSPEEITVAAGSCSLIDQLILRLVKQDENIVMPEISFVAYKLCAEIHNREYRQAAMDNYHISLNNILSLCDNKTRLVFLANPNNPTGTIITHAQIIAFLNQVSKETYIVLDEAYLDYVDDKDFPDYHSIIRQYENVIILRSFSKVYGLAGLRVGYSICQKKICEDLETNKIPFTINVLSNYAALAALTDHGHVNKCIIKNAEGRKLIYDGLLAQGYHPIPSQGNFIYINFSSTEERDSLFSTLFENKILTRKMETFGDKLALRISIGKTEENIRIVNCLDRILK